jgi:hypothetical protein
MKVIHHEFEFLGADLVESLRIVCHTPGSGTVLSLFSLKVACQVEYRLNSKYSLGSKVSLASICNGSNH